MLKHILGKIFHPDDVAQMLDRYRRRLAGEDVPPFSEARFIRFDESKGWMEVKSSQISWKGLPATVNFFSDITLRKEAEIALRESEEKFRLISEQSLMAIVIVQDDRIKYANQAYFEMTGYTSEEIMNWTMGDIVQTIYPEDRHFVMEQGRKKAAGIRDGVVTHYSYRGITKGGEVRWIDQYSKTITYKGKPSNLLTFIDINNQKLAQETLMQSEKRYRDLADSLPQIVFETDENGKLTFVNRNAFDIFGYSQHDFDNGINSIEMLIPEDRNRAMEEMQRVMCGEASGSNEYTALRKDGSTFPISINSNALIRENKLMGIRGIIIDLSQAKKAEEALRKSEEKYRLIAENTADLISVLNMNLQFTYVSPSNMRLLGYTVEEAMEQTLEQFLTPESLRLGLTSFKKRCNWRPAEQLIPIEHVSWSWKDIRRMAPRSGWRPVFLFCVIKTTSLWVFSSYPEILRIANGPRRN